MIKTGLLCAMLGLSIAQAAPPLSCFKQMSLPIYPKIAKIAHDSRLVSVTVKPTDSGFQVLEIRGGNKFFDKSIREAVSSWRVSPSRPIAPGKFVIAFDFKLSEEKEKDGLYEIDIDGSRITIWGLKQFTDVEKLPINTYK